MLDRMKKDFIASKLNSSSAEISLKIISILMFEQWEIFRYGLKNIGKLIESDSIKLKSLFFMFNINWTLYHKAYFWRKCSAASCKHTKFTLP